MSMENLTIKQAKKKLKELEEIKKIFNLREENQTNKSNSTLNEGWEIGKNYFIRTVTHILIGKLISINSQEILLKQASWIADTGRYADCMGKGIENIDDSEIEPYPKEKTVIVGRRALIDAVIYDHSIDIKQK